MRPLIERFVRGESGVAAYSLVAAVPCRFDADQSVRNDGQRKGSAYFAGGGTKWSRDGRSTACSGRRCRRPCSIGAKIRHGYSASLRH